ncbi:cobalt ECF transporter T component CbiQ [Salidesulfovibrio onnuriiensis]|uniref:cobalt ECF transporter T component CbiQ n=1 Tax=Salidesulfovibrio onnuriiensis TaxID=2583823 RepID=UPI0011C83F3E|nr:cobalt ECF transporter T component CbiQ [Salidesulfovibrio onnuriiensis]
MVTISEPFAHGDSVIHRADPRARLVSALLLTIPMALLTTSWAAGISVAVGLVLVFLAALSPVAVMNRLLAVNLFIAFLWIFLPFSTPGAPLLVLGPLAVAREGIHLALLLTLKSNAVVLCLMALMGSIRIQDMGPAMQSLRLPVKLCHLFLFTFRYIFVIRKEYQTMTRAMAVRGFKPRTNLHTYRSYAWLVGMLLVKSWDRAERVYNAMLCRGFQGRFYTLANFNFTTGDIFFITTAALAALGITACDLLHRGLI